MPKRSDTPVNTGFTNIDRMLNSPVINRAGLASLMYPGNKSPGKYLYSKLNRLQRQSFTTEDRKKVENIFADIFNV